jgi:large-conductance mechanosensitive channel
MAYDSTVLTFAVAIYIGSALKEFFGAITRDLVTPFIAAVIPNTQQTLDKITVQIGPVKLNIGDLISATLNLFVAYLIVTLTMPYVREYIPVGTGRKSY